MSTINGYTPKELCEGIERDIGYKAGELRLLEVLHAYDLFNFIRFALLTLPNGELALNTHMASVKIPYLNVSKLNTKDLLFHMYRGNVCKHYKKWFRNEVIDEKELLIKFRAYKMWEKLPSVLSFIEKTKAWGLLCNLEFLKRAMKAPRHVPLKLLFLSTDIKNHFGPYATEMFNDLMGNLDELTKNLILPSERDNQWRLSSEHDAEKKSEQKVLLCKKLDEISKLKHKDRTASVLNGKWKYALNDIKNNLYKNIIRTQLAQRRMPAGDIQSLDEEVESAHGSKTSMLELLVTQNESLQTQQMIMEFEFNDYQKNALKEFLNEDEIKILEITWSNPDLTQEEIAPQAGCSQGEVSKSKSAFKKYAAPVKKILGLPQKK